LPLISDLKIAAGYWSEEQAALVEDPATVEDWIELPPGIRPEPGMFVACIQGRSMEPLVQDGDWCVFRAPRAGSRAGKRVLVWHSGLRDSETGNSYTFKEYHSDKVITDETFEHTRIVLKPLNKNFIPIVLTPENEGSVRIVGEFVMTLSG
jgi:SOS-response transcriptional repressor LexA